MSAAIFQLVRLHTESQEVECTRSSIDCGVGAINPAARKYPDNGRDSRFVEPYESTPFRSLRSLMTDGPHGAKEKSFQQAVFIIQMAALPVTHRVGADGICPH